MNGKKPSKLLSRALLFCIFVLTVGFLGFGVRAFSTPDITRLVFAGVVIASIGIPVWYFILHRSAREVAAHSPVQSIASAERAFSRAWRRIGDSFLPRKGPLKLGERMGAEAGVVRVPKLPDSRRAA